MLVKFDLVINMENKIINDFIIIIGFRIGDSNAYNDYRCPVVRWYYYREITTYYARWDTIN